MLLTAGRNDGTCGCSRRHTDECAFAATGNASNKSSQSSPSSRFTGGGLPLGLPLDRRRWSRRRRFVLALKH